MQNTTESTTATVVNEVTNKAIEVGFMEFLDKIGEYASKLTDEVYKKAPEAYDALLNLIQLQNGFYLLKDFIIFSLMLSLSAYLWSKVEEVVS